MKPVFARADATNADLFLALEGGILGRVDDMVVIRGVNVYPSAVEEIIRGLGGIAEYRVRVINAGALAELCVEIEPEANCPDPEEIATQLERRFQSSLALRVDVRLAEPSSLPRFENKAKRWVRG